MSVEVETRDCASLTDIEIEELAAMGGYFQLAAITKAKEDWVLFTSAKISGKCMDSHSQRLSALAERLVYCLA